MQKNIDCAIIYLLLLKMYICYKVLDYFHLSSFENDSDYVVLKLNEDKKDLFNDLFLINKGLRIKYDVSVEFDNYSPHITLAELKPGMAKKYMDSEKLNMILEDTYLDFYDIILSYGSSNEVKDRKQYHLTSYNSLPRYFKMFNEERELETLLKN